MNIAKILENCPKGMKLYSPIYGEVEFIEVSVVHRSIGCKINGGSTVYFHSDGTFYKGGECMLFPAKGENWDNFQIPFNNGDVIIMTEPNGINRLPNIAIFKKYDNDNKINPMRIYCQFNAVGEFIPHEMNVSIGNLIWRKANAPEIASFISEMYEAGYQFVDNKVIKLIKPKFKVGDIITNNKLTFRIDVIDDKHYIEMGNSTSYKIAISEQDRWKIKVIIPKFKVGDTIVWHASSGPGVEIKEIKNNRYILDNDCSIGFDEQNCYKIVKFDKTTLKPYDKVLVKYFEDGCWAPTLVSYVNSSGLVYTIDSDEGTYRVIPFEGHEHLVAEYDDPKPYYITWDDSED